jgi:hypothetical protein
MAYRRSNNNSQPNSAFLVSLPTSAIRAAEARMPWREKLMATEQKDWMEDALKMFAVARDVLAGE